MATIQIDNEKLKEAVRLNYPSNMKESGQKILASAQVIERNCIFVENSELYMIFDHNYNLIELFVGVDDEENE